MKAANPNALSVHLMHGSYYLLLNTGSKAEVNPRSVKVLQNSD